MLRPLAAVALVVAAAVGLSRPAPARRILRLPSGVVEVHSEIAVDAGTEVYGRQTVLRAAVGFTGRAVMVVRGAGVRLRDFTVDGNRAANEVRSGLPPYDVPFARFTRNNGILAEDARDLAIENVRLQSIAGFAILVSRSHGVAIDRVHVDDSGSRNALGRNNTTGGILLEEGTIDFQVLRSSLRNVLGNGIWTHSLYTSPRNARGLIAFNSIENVGRDAIQVGHATDIRVDSNYGQSIGFPVEAFDVESLALPVALDTAGNVEGSSYTNNQFGRVNGKCIDLDGFHDGEVRGNLCADVFNFAIVMNNSNPDMQSRNIRLVENQVRGAWYGGVFVIGTGHQIARNRFVDLNQQRCGACFDLLHSGVYLAAGAARPDPARNNAIEDNEITGNAEGPCIGFAPGITPAQNTIRRNRCGLK